MQCLVSEDKSALIEIESEPATKLPARLEKLMQCLVSEDKFALIDIERSLTIEKCLDAPLLINQKDISVEIIKSIFIVVKRFNDLLNVGKKMNEDQMIALSSDLYERFGTESLDDVLLFFKMARSGGFGDIYRLDSIIVLSWVEKYLLLKIQARENDIQNQRNVRQRKENDEVKNYVPDDKAIENLEKLSKMIKVTAVTRNTGVFRKDNPLFDYNSYLETLPEAAKKMDDEKLDTMIGNTSQYSHPEVFKILQTEKQIRQNDRPKRNKRKSSTDEN